MRTNTARTAIAAAALAASLGLTGCSIDFAGGSDDKKEASSQQDQQGASQQQASGDSGDSADSADDSEGESGDDGGSQGDAPSGEALATAEVPIELDGDDKATMTVRLISVQKNNQTVEAIYGFTLNSQMSDAKTSLFSANGGHSFAPYAVDTKNFNKHSEISELSDSNVSDELYAGKEMRHKVAFGAPPDDVKEMDVVLWDGQPLVKGVKIQ